MDGLEARGIELRPAAPGDDDLIRRVLGLASTWRDDRVDLQLDGVPTAYYEDWGRPDDVGVLAFLGVEFVGGGYLRRVGPADGTYGYLDGDCFELTMGVEAPHRAQGVGRLLVEVLKAKAIERGIAGISLSVEPDNAIARAMYTSARFTIVEERDGDLLMGWTSPIWGAS